MGILNSWKGLPPFLLVCLVIMSFLGGGIDDAWSVVFPDEVVGTVSTSPVLAEDNWFDPDVFAVNIGGRVVLCDSMECAGIMSGQRVVLDCTTSDGLLTRTTVNCSYQGAAP